MQCHQCHSEMQLTERVAEGRAEQRWYQCPVCAAHHTISQPHEACLKRIGNLQRCSSEWPQPARLVRNFT
ncbi:hypothetical protein [Thiosocius teredinicola]|uniref:hypothetical protein n=1 Tax=Thiosocius teredinicola TaxID=1973002 RepID=UPI000F7ACB53